jgi:anti-sigma-K factor RskA
MEATHPRDDEHVHTLTGAYALDALDDVERARVERHLAMCSSCAAELRGFGETTARLAAGAATTPPPPLRERVLSEAARTRQLPPETGMPSAPVAGSTTAVRWLSVAAAALLVLSVSLGAVAWNQHRQAEQARVAADAMTDVLADPDRTVVDADFGEGHGTVVVSGQRVVLMGDAVAPPPGGHGYQLWFIGEDGPRPSDMLEPAGDGRYWVDAHGIEAGDAVGVTVEPDGGSQEPTTDPVMVAQTTPG